jgi:hypothetical protein
MDTDPQLAGQPARQGHCQMLAAALAAATAAVFLDRARAACRRAPVTTA